MYSTAIHFTMRNSGSQSRGANQTVRYDEETVGWEALASRPLSTSLMEQPHEQN